DHLVAGAGDEFACDRSRNAVCQPVAGRVVGKRRNGDGVDGFRKQICLAAYMITTRGEQQSRQKQSAQLHGASLAKACSGTPTAFSAVSRKLSAAIQNHAARGWLRSTEIAPTAMPLWPARPTLFGGSSPGARTSIRADWRDPASVSAPRFNSNSTQTEK